jgi:peptidoglycan/xylan/chitin deacetylase (PgdA/CDA1 family)
MGSKQLVLTFDDACKSHLNFVLPVLQQYGFGATFFISRPEHWLQKDLDAYLNCEEISQIYCAGFEIGNHTMNHRGMSELSDDECRAELKMLNDQLAQYGIPAPVSFAYPGGPYCAEAAQILPEFGIRAARTTEHGLWEKAKNDPMRVPCFSVSEQHENNFYAAVDLANEDENCAAMILYHGVPDLPHPWCSTPEDMFLKHMKYLADNNFRVMSMRDFIGI